MKNNRISYYLVSAQEDSRGAVIKATFHDHFLEMAYERRETPDGFLWFGEIMIDAQMIWKSPEVFGCKTRQVLEGEVQHQLYSWALRKGYVARPQLK
jgi:hypothetical protein